MTKLACKECGSTSVDRDGDCMACGASFDLIEEQWVGDEGDGCYVRVYEGKGFEVEVVVDSETGSFVDTLTTLDGFTTADEAMKAGRDAAIEWCITNQVNYGDDKSFRLVVCIDVEAPNLADAYGQVYKAMSATGLEWESSDEWFDEGDNSDGGDADELQAARMAYFRETEEERCEHGLFFSGAGACPQCGGGAE